MLRQYQQEAVDAVINHIRLTTESCVLEAATGAGKSHIIAAIAEWIHKRSQGKSVLCIAPSKELVEQNREKYLATGNPASLFSASVGQKCLRHPIVFGTPVSVLNSIDKFGSRFSAVIIDECHRISPTIKKIISAIERHNPNLRVIGLTATPYRLGTGYIYEIDDSDSMVLEAKEPYFKKLVYRITADELIHQNYLTKPTIGHIDEHYDTSGLQTNSMGNFTADSVDRAFVGQGRLTSKIVSQIVELSQNRNGVMIFCSTVKHAQEALESLPLQLSRIVTGETKKGEREKILADFKAMKIKYLVNVSVLTTGFDAPHVDVIAVLRATESAALYQQIVGRGLRLFDGKSDCLVLDYAENIERHCPDGDIFRPVITVKGGGGTEKIPVYCPECSHKNIFAMRPNPDKYDVDEDGYFIDLQGNHICDPPIPAHMGRRCFGVSLSIDRKFTRCDHRWFTKTCLECDHDNDIAARYCEKCKAELVDPNEKLKLDFARYKKDPYQIQTDSILAIKAAQHISKAGNLAIRAEVTTEYRSFTAYISPLLKGKWSRLFGNHSGCSVSEIVDLLNTDPPATITYHKQSKSGYFDITGFNQPVDEVQSD